MKYKCLIGSGNGTKNDGGIWEKVETPKRIVFKQIEECFFNPVFTKFQIDKFYRRDSHQTVKGGSALLGDKWCNNGHVLEVYEDGSYVAYINQSGIPYFFEPYV